MYLPVCKNASVAKYNGEESGIDIATAEATGRAISTWLPETVFIENVWRYRHFKAFHLLCDVLTKNGYWFDVNHLNAADVGVPQTRKRLIVRATRAGWLPPLPNKTPWRGWHEAIEDLIPTLPESKFAPWQLERWQLERLPDFDANALVDGSGNTSRAPTVLQPQEPSMTIQAWHGRRPIQAPRAFIVEGSAACTRSGGGTLPRAFIVDGKPANYAGDLQVISGDCPVVTITASQPRHPFRAWLSQGRVVSMTPRALGRFMGLNDSFELSGKASVDCTGIGNGVCPPLSESLIKPFLVGGS